jgi:hypothetical protein
MPVDVEVLCTTSQHDSEFSLFTVDLALLVSPLERNPLQSLLNYG